jgi:hypothetical protein
MNRVWTKEVEFESYAGIVPEDIFTDVTQVAEKLKGLRIIHVVVYYRTG